MLFAADDSGQKIKPSYSGQLALCPACEKQVKAYCGSILTWHWKHVTSLDCDAWHEESLWHQKWKARFLIKEQEVVITQNNKKHRADVCLGTKFGNLILEFQASSIPIEEVEAREGFYKNMVWIVKADQVDLTLTKAKANQKSPIGLSATRNGFRWRHPKKWVQLTKRPVFLELDDGHLFLIEKITPPGGRCYGWGWTFDNWRDVVRCAFLTGLQVSHKPISNKDLRRDYFWQPFRGAISQLGLSSSATDKKRFKLFCEWLANGEISNVKTPPTAYQEIFEEVFGDQFLLKSFYQNWQELSL